MDVTQCKNKILELFRTGDKTNIELGMILAESQGIDLQESCKDYLKMSELFGPGGITLDRIIYAISNKRMLARYHDSSFIIPKEIELFTSLKFIEITGCGLTTIPDEIVNLKKLEILELRNNSFKNIPKVIFKIPNLAYLDLQNNEFSEIDKVVIKKEFEEQGVECYI